jgi:hypothetical protein
MLPSKDKGNITNGTASIFIFPFGIDGTTEKVDTCLKEASSSSMIKKDPQLKMLF